MFNKISFVLGIVLMVVYTMICLYLQVVNIDVTELRLLITYWKFYVSVVIPLALIYYGIYR
jgi:hypothetical protein